VLRWLLATPPEPEKPLGARDRAMLLLAFAAALRRSELVALNIGDVESVAGRALLLTIGRSPTDQVGAGQRVALHANPASRAVARPPHWRPGCATVRRRPTSIGPPAPPPAPRDTKAARSPGRDCPIRPWCA
jgi:hypothetical protein